MKNIFFYSFVLTGLFITTSCQKDVTNRTANLPALQPSNTDAGAGSWKPVLLSSPLIRVNLINVVMTFSYLLCKMLI